MKYSLLLWATMWSLDVSSLNLMRLKQKILMFNTKSRILAAKHVHCAGPFCLTSCQTIRVIPYDY
jgi:hypothetical protein